MNVSINILFVAHPRHNMPQVLGRKIFRQFFHLPLTGLSLDYSPILSSSSPGLPDALYFDVAMFTVTDIP